MKSIFNSKNTGLKLYKSYHNLNNNIEQNLINLDNYQFTPLINIEDIEIDNNIINNKINNPNILILKKILDLVLNIKSTSDFTDKSLKDTQIKLEKFLHAQAELLVKEIKINKNIYSIDKNILKIFLEKKPFLEAGLKNYKVKLLKIDENLTSLDNKIIYNIDSKYLISLMLGKVISVISHSELLQEKNNSVQNMIDLGQDVIRKYIKDCYDIYISSCNIKKKNELSKELKSMELCEEDIKLEFTEKSFFDWKNENYDWIKNTEDINLKFNLGNILVNILIDLELIQIKILPISLKKKESILISGIAYDDIMDKLKDKKLNPSSINLLPKKLPMISKPKEYIIQDNKYLELGGYYLNGIEYLDEIILSNWELSTSTTLLNDNQICDMVNKMNSIAFKINVDVLKFIVINNDKYNFYVNPDYVHPLEIEEKDKLSTKKKNILLKFKSIRFLEQNILSLAFIYKDIPKIYLPIKLDYRGRIYCVTEFLNYQGSELAKGLLKFAVEEKVNIDDKWAINYLKIYGANNYGNKLNKKSLKDRIKWVDDNLANIINFNNGVLLNEAENKILFIAFCFEFKKYWFALNNKEKFFLTSLPIQFDASCNGFQHLCMLIDDVALSEQLNLNKSNWDDIPADFYGYISLKIKNYISDNLSKHEAGELVLSKENLESYQRLFKLEIDRSLVKKAIMTFPYNASASSIENYIKDNFLIESTYKTVITLEKKDKITKKKKLIEKEKINYKYKLKNSESLYLDIDFQNIRIILYFVIFNDYTKLKKLLEYLKSIANVSNKLKIPIPWILPLGLEVRQQFYKSEILEIKLNPYTKNILNLGIIDKTKFNVNKQKIALMPNLVHSLDAASLSLVIVNFLIVLENENFFSVHDCFATTCNKIKILTDILKGAYCALYTESKYLLKFDDYFRTSIINTFGKNSVIFNNKNLTVKLANDENIKVKFPSVSEILSEDKSKINVKESAYIIH